MYHKPGRGVGWGGEGGMLVSLRSVNFGCLVSMRVDRGQNV